ncbi:epoxide hydrolase 4 isoform X2 [Lingula anatina]|uniref:Epoxide hydrolase 4 isoform X2 n=1 Tax=Lingula anatina TaxID=7574 RepID=A0A1S3J3P2_LINAN|nr:epoxide hydrolase 4 isoform X2 [Lingula anatina]|eukprot:XP_013405032.1 epoxide hydrolase 4 isoform X2 [Lingula anatina]
MTHHVQSDVNLTYANTASFLFKILNKVTSPSNMQYVMIRVKELEPEGGEGIKMHYVANGGENMPLMLLLHGFPEFWYSWRHQLKIFCQNYRVVAVDTRGCGESEQPKGIYSYDLKKLRDDIKELILSFGYNSCILVGHDWGGAMAWAVAGKYPELVDKLIIMNCPHPAVMGPYLKTHYKQMLKSWYMFFFCLPYLPEWLFLSGDLKMIENTFCGKVMGAKPGAFTPEDIEAFKYTFSRPGTVTCAMNYIRAAILGKIASGGYGKPKALIQAPTLVIWGTNDGALQSEMAELSGKHCRDFTLKFIEGASHWVQQDEPDIVNQHITAFLAK